jgi:anhydro-N-acetylmuramic acid kinase
MIVIGLMSGTSADGVDAAIVELHGAWPDLRWRLIHHLTLPYATTLRHEILANCDPRTGTVDRICTLHVVIGRAFADAAIATVQAAGLSLSQVDLIGSHGQTIWHAPQGDPPATLQIGCAATIAERCGVSVVSDFRSRDVAAGGQGAPLVAAVDLLLLTHPTRTRAAQNIGGIGNVTFLPPTSPAAGRQSDREAFAFDTGPGNMLIDAAVAHQSDGALHYDRGGLIAAQGQVHQTLLAELLDDPFFRQTPPKTTGREQYGAAAFERIRLRASQLGVTQTDLVATLTALTAESIAAAYRDFLPQPLDEVLVSGGGAHNPTLMRMLSERLVPASVITSDTIGLPSDAKEALAFAVLAYETWHGRPGNLPAATGAARPVVLGSITPAGPKTQDPRPKIQGDKEIGAAEPQAEDPRPKTQTAKRKA